MTGNAQSPRTAALKRALYIIGPVAVAAGIGWGVWAFGWLGPRPTEREALQSACLAAARKAVAAEIERFERYAKPSGAAEDDSPAMRERVKTLYADRERLARMKPAEFALPKPLELLGRQTDGGVIYYEGLSKSGPWYNVIAAAQPLTPERVYRMTCYVVYPRWYFGMTSGYVYVARRE